MKTTLKLIIAALAAITTFASCQKENAANDGNGNPSTDGVRVLTLSFDPGTKATLNGLQPEFQDGEYVRISNGSSEEKKQISVVDGVATVTTSLSGTLTAVIPSDAAKLDVNKIVGVEIPSYQSGKESDALICMATGAPDATRLHFRCQTALFIITPPVGVKQFEIQASGQINNTSDSKKILVGNGTDIYEKYYVSLKPGVGLNQLSFVAGTVEKKIDNTTATVANTAYTITNANWLPVGPLSGKFTVNDEGKQVQFSQGKLVATINASGAPTAWKFATNQYDYIGKGGANEKIGIDVGDVDLFGWSTLKTQFGISTSSSPADYAGDFVDWGKNIGDGNTWRTLTTAEWQYLLGSSTVRSGKYKSDVTVCGNENCLIIAPDDFTGTIADTYDATDWPAAEAAGLVCLAAAGYRDGSTVQDVGVYGYYWSSSAYDDGDAYEVYFDSGYVGPDNDGCRYYGDSVRLITDVTE